MESGISSAVCDLLDDAPTPGNKGNEDGITLCNPLSEYGA
eukprot:gene42930-57089_t